MGEKIYVSIPLDGQFAAGSVNELGVRQNLNYLNHRCCENKQEIFIFKLNESTFYTHPTTVLCMCIYNNNNNKSPGFQVRHRDITVSAQIFAQPLSDLFSQRHCQLCQTVSCLT